MGQVSTELTYAGHNTYRMDPYEEMHATMFDVSLYSDVTIQVVTINPASLASGSVHLCWIDGDNKRIGNIVVESVSVLKRFTEWWKAFEVPENAVRLHWWIKAGSTGFNFGCAMATPGTIRRAFSSNLEDRVSMITADGLYTSTISGNQILAGIIRALTGDAWFDLEKPEIVMKGVDADLYIDPANPLKVTDKNGNLLGGLMSIDGNIVLTSEYITTPTDPMVAASIGTVVDSSNVSHTGFIVWAKKADGTYERSLLISPDHDGQYLRIYGPGEHTWFAMYAEAQGTIYLRTEHCGLSMIHGSTSLFIIDNDGKDEVFLSLATDSSGTEASLSAKRNNTSYGEIGLDTGGPYAIRTNGTKVYL